MSQLIDYPQQKPVPEFDRSGRILTAAILLCLCGVAFAGIAILTPLSLIVPQPAGRPQVGIAQIIAVLIIYLALGGIFISLSIGGFMKRRWFRPLSLILIVHWLIIGSISFVFFVVMFPLMNEVMETTLQNSPTPMPPGFAIIIQTVMLIFILLFAVALPALLLWLIWSEQVIQTLAHYSPPSWTDTRPIRILGMAITLILAGLIVLSMLANPLVPFVAIYLKGLPAIILIAISSVLLLYAGYQILKLKMQGWWIGLLVITFYSLISIPVPLVQSPVELYRQMGQPPEVIEAANQHIELLRAVLILFPVAMLISFPIYMWRNRSLLAEAIRVKGEGVRRKENTQLPGA